MDPRRIPLWFLLLLLPALLGAACFNDDPAADTPPAATAPAESGDTAPAAPGAAPPRSGTGAGLAAEADANGQNSAATPAASVEPEVQADDDAEATADPPAEPAPPLQAAIFVEPETVVPGEVFLVAVDARNASAVSIALEGQFVSMAREGDRFYAILPVAFETPAGPLPLVVAIADLNGQIALQQLLQVEVQEGDFPVELVEVDATLSRLFDPAVVAEDRALRDDVQRVRTPLRMWQGYFHLPTEGVISSTFGLLRSYNGAEPTDFHSGLDFSGPLGTDVVAANAGIVAWTGETERRGRGVIIDHGQGVFSSYWHLANVATTSGTAVDAGVLIGRIGNTGLSTGPHLHWELTVYGVPVDPLPWLRELEVPDPLAPLDPLRAVNVAAAARGG